MKILHTLSLLLLASSLSGPFAVAAPVLPARAATAATVVPPDVSYPLQLQLDATGAIVAIDYHDAVPDSLLGLVERAAARSRFAPATRDGRPVPARVWITVRVGFAAVDGGFRASVRSVVAGGGIAWGELPRSMPMDTRARGFSADVRVLATFAADGEVIGGRSRVQSVTITRDPGTREFAMLEEGLRKRFRGVVKRSMRNWRWTPDEVDGQPIGGVFRMPVAFPSPGAQRDASLAPNPLPDIVFEPVAAGGLVPARLLP